MEKRYLFTPGPTPVPPEVLAASAEPIVHHRGPDFRDVYERTLSRLKDVHRTSSDVLLFTSSGSGAMESAVANLCAAGDRVAVVSHGSFGERWIKICEQHELDVVPIEANSHELARRYRALGGSAEIVVLAGLGHGGRVLYESEAVARFLLGD